MKKIINKNNVKISYSYKINNENIIKCLNSKIFQTNRDKNRLKRCNCRKKHNCQLKNNECRKENVIYEAKIQFNNDNKVYIGLTENEIKKRILVHMTTFKIDPDQKIHLKYKNSTELFKEIHKLKEKKTRI